MSLLRDRSPATTWTEERGTDRISEKKSTTAALARPSTGGAESEIFKASPNVPLIAVRAARG